jgi:hypothetical protein
VAKILGVPGRYTSDQATLRTRKLIQTAVLFFIGVGILAGICFGLALPRLHITIATALISDAFLVGVLILVSRYTLRRLDTLDRERDMMRKGTEGETKTATLLGALPDEYSVIHGLNTRCFGDLDHVVIGPTGVHVIDTKNWRGVIESDGTGELLLNGSPLKSATVKRLVGRAMGVRDQIRVLAPGNTLYFNVVIVFTAAWVFPIWGKTGAATCIRDEQLVDYITNFNKSRLEAARIDALAQAFLALATMDTEFVH